MGKPASEGCARPSPNAAFATALLTLIGEGASHGRDAVEAALGNAQGGTGIERMMRAAAALGSPLRREDRTLASLASAAAIFPAATLAADHRPFVVLSADATGALLVAPDSDGHARFATWGEVGEALGLAPEAVAPWVVGERETGLDGLRGGAGAPHGLPPLKRLLAWVRLERDDVGVTVVYAVGVGLLSLATPLGVQFLVNTVAFGALVQPLVVLSLLVAAGLSFAAVLRALQAYVVERLQQRLFARVALDLAQRLPRVELDALDGRHGPELMNRFFEIASVQKGASTMLVDGVAIVLQTLVGALLLAFYHPFLLAFDIVLIASLVFIVAVLGRGAIATAIKESKAKYSLAAWLQETARHVEVFKLQNGDLMARARAESLTVAYLSARKKHFKIVFRQLIGALAVQALASAALLGIGGWLVIARQLSLGQLVAAELIVTAVVAGFSKLGKYFESFYDLIASVDKLGHLTDLPIEALRPLRLPAAACGLELEARNVSVRAGSGHTLSGVNLSIRAGGSVAIYGASGAGKSALVDALIGVRPHRGGRLDVDGIAIDEIETSSLRGEIAVVRQDGLFEGTIDDNLRLGRGDLTRQDSRLALQRVGIWDAVCAMPEGLDTLVATHGKGLPSDLVHRLVIARAIATRPRLLVLDGVLDVLTPESCERVWKAVAAPDRPWSLVLTTTDRARLAWCDHAYQLDHGLLSPALVKESA